MGNEAKTIHSTTTKPTTHFHKHIFLSFGLSASPRRAPRSRTWTQTAFQFSAQYPSSQPHVARHRPPCPICPPCWSPAAAATLRGRSPTGSHVIQLVLGPRASLFSLNHDDRPPAGRRATRNRALHVSKSTTSILEGDPCARLNVWNASPRHDKSQSAAPSRFVPQRGDQ